MKELLESNTSVKMGRSKVFFGAKSKMFHFYSSFFEFTRFHDLDQNRLLRFA